MTRNRYAPQPGKRRAKKVLCALLAVVLVVVVGSFGVRFAKQKLDYALYPRTYAQQVEQQAQGAGLDPNLVFAVIRQESGFDADAVSHAGAMGLMQIMPDTFSWLQTKLDEEDGRVYTEEDLLDPEVNIRFGCLLLSLLTDRYADLRTALAAYNAGMGNVDNWLQDSAYSSDGRTLSDIQIEETREYTEKVLRNYQEYQALYD